MACNCTTNEQLEKLYEQFGQKRQLTGNETFWFKVKDFLTKIGVGFCLILIIPYMLFYIIRHGFFGDGRISVAHFFGFREKIVK
jgi:hypothetical protein